MIQLENEENTETEIIQIKSKQTNRCTTWLQYRLTISSEASSVACLRSSFSMCSRSSSSMVCRWSSISASLRFLVCSVLMSNSSCTTRKPILLVSTKRVGKWFPINISIHRKSLTSKRQGNRSSRDQRKDLWWWQEKAEDLHTHLTDLIIGMSKN